LKIVSSAFCRHLIEVTVIGWAERFFRTVRNNSPNDRRGVGFSWLITASQGISAAREKDLGDTLNTPLNYRSVGDADVLRSCGRPSPSE